MVSATQPAHDQNQRTFDGRNCSHFEFMSHSCQNFFVHLPPEASGYQKTRRLSNRMAEIFQSRYRKSRCLDRPDLVQPSVLLDSIDPLGGVDSIMIPHGPVESRSEEHTSELQSLMRISYAVFCLK